MGGEAQDVTTTPSRAPMSLSTPSSTARRTARYGSRSSSNTSGGGGGGGGGTTSSSGGMMTMSTTTTTMTRNLESVRPPIIVEIGSSILRVGYAGNSSPTHLIPMPTALGLYSGLSLSQNNENNNKHNYSEAEWYTLLSPWVEMIYDRLLCPPKTRKVLIVLSSSLSPLLYVSRTYVAALQQLFWNHGAPSVSVMGGLEFIPMSHGWKRGLILSISQTEASCVCHCDGHLLPFTYQSVPECGYGNWMTGSTKKDAAARHNTHDLLLLQREWTSLMDYWLLDELHNPNSLTVALLKCLEACPRDVRYDVAYHVVVCGDGALVLPDVGRRVVGRLEQILEGTQAELTLPETTVGGAAAAGGGNESSTAMTAIPLPIASLKPLASRLRLLDCHPHRPDFLAWIGASLWAATWNRYDAEESRIQWKSPPRE